MFWGIRDLEPFPKQSFNFTALCLMNSGRRAVLKLGYPADEDVIANQARMLNHFGGEFAPELYEFEEEFDALLMEALEPGKTLVQEFPDKPENALAAGLKVFEGLPRTAPRSFTIPDLGGWFDVLESESCGIVPDEVLEGAASELPGLLRQETSLLHGDFHHGNILSSSDGAFKVIDPECAKGPLGYDAAVFLNDHYRWLLDKDNEQDQMALAVNAFSSAIGIAEPTVCKWALCQIALCMCWDVEDFGRFRGHDLAIARRWLERIS